MKSKFLGFSAKLALCCVAVLGTLTSCYEKEDITTVIDTSSKSVNYVISGSIANATNLKGISDARITVTAPGTAPDEYKKPSNANSDGYIYSDEDGLFSIKYTFTTKQGATQSDIDELIKKVCGTYVLKIEADGYNDRSTQVELQFSAFENQTISTHLDFLLKSKAIQGVAEEIVAGATEQILTIDGASADGTGTVSDKIVIPAGAFGTDANGNIVKTITIMRASLAEESSVAAARIYEGKPDGTQFVIPMEVTFTYPEALVGTEGLCVLYEKADGTWVNDESGKIEKVSANLFKASVYHFSKFMFGQKPINEAGTSSSYAVKEDIATVLDKIGDNKYHNSANTSKTFDMTIQGVKVGSKYHITLDKVFEGITDATAKAVAVYQTQQYVDKIMGKNAPAADFREINVVEPITVAAHSDLLYIVPTRYSNEWTFTMSFAGKEYTIVADEYLTYKYEPTVQDYTHGHGHGHGHGDDLNAGGGIITFE